MTVTEIIVSAGRTFNHPYEDYSNLKPHVTLKATLAEGEDFETAVKGLQAKAESLVQDHKNALLEALHRHERMRREDEEVSRLESTIQQAQDRLAQARALAQEARKLGIGTGEDQP